MSDPDSSTSREEGRVDAHIRQGFDTYRLDEAQPPRATGVAHEGAETNIHYEGRELYAPTRPLPSPYHLRDNYSGK